MKPSISEPEPHQQAPARLLVVPGLHDSPRGHWQDWLQSLFPDAVRVTQRNWSEPDIERWAGRVGSVMERAGPGPWLAVAHSFGALAVVRHLALVARSPLAAVLLVAPADPDRFGIGELLPQHDLGVPSTLLLSSNDPWLPLAAGQRWAGRWCSPCVNLGAAGHVNVQSGHATLPYARHWVLAQRARLSRLATKQSRFDSFSDIALIPSMHSFPQSLLQGPLR